MRMLFAVVLIVSLLGISICDLTSGDYKTFVIGLLFAVANVFIFVVK